MKKTLIGIFVVIGLLLSGCGPGTSEGYYCPTMDEFVDRFGEKFAIPTYFPSGFAPEDTGVMFQGVGAFTKEAFHRQGRDGYKNYKEFDIYSSISIRMTLETDMAAPHSLIFVAVSRPMVEKDSGANSTFETIPGNQHDAKICEYISPPAGSTADEPYDNYAKEQWLNIQVEIPVNEVDYIFSFVIHINPTETESAYVTLREELRNYCIDETMKMYESLKYIQ